jgi:hypothetical protein
MILKISAVIAAAACAGLIVGGVPEFASQSAASVPQPPDPVASQTALVPQAAAVPTSGCEQAWPYYRPECLRDGRPASAKFVRVIAIDRPAAPSPAQLRH